MYFVYCVISSGTVHSLFDSVVVDIQKANEERVMKMRIFLRLKTIDKMAKYDIPDLVVGYFVYFVHNMNWCSIQQFSNL